MKPFVTRSCPIRAALLASAALLGWGVLLAPDQHHPRATAPSAASPHVPMIARLHNNVRRRAASPNAGFQPSSTIDRHASDVVVEAYPLRESQLAALRLADRIELPHPDGGTIELDLTRIESSHGRCHLTLVHDGLISTFTIARGSFFGTLATTRGVYALEGDRYRSTLIRQALLDQRMNSHALDYRPIPSA